MPEFQEQEIVNYSDCEAERCIWRLVGHQHRWTIDLVSLADTIAEFFILYSYWLWGGPCIEHE